MGSPNFFSYNVDALLSMTNQQLEVSNEVHMHSHPPTPLTPQPGLAPHIPETSLLIVTTVPSPSCPLYPTLPPNSSEYSCLGQ